jgi:predicted AlkP superfamily phosphohydrolase/phosphomutase
VYSVSRGNDGFIYLLQDDKLLRNETRVQLRDKLAEIIDPENNRKIVEKIHFSDEIYHGSKMHLMPDIIVKPAPGYTFTGDYSHTARKFFVTVTKKNDFHIGTHHADGILIAAGENIRKQSEITNARLLDMAPTILACLGVPIPSQMDGSVLQEMFDKTVQLEYKNETSPATSEEKQHLYSDTDVEQIESRLRDLGYLE